MLRNLVYSTHNYAPSLLRITAITTTIRLPPLTPHPIPPPNNNNNAAAAAFFSTSPSPKMPMPSYSVNFDTSNKMSEENPHLSEVLISLLARNQNFAKGFAVDQPELLSKLAKGQAPKVCWIGCSDSRVPEGSVCQTYPGEIFTIRNVANQWHEKDDSATAALTFAIESLGVEDIIVVGHTSCGGINAAISGSANGPPEETASTSLGRYLIPLTKHAYQLKQAAAPEEMSLPVFLSKLTTENVKQQLENLKESEVIQRNWSTGESTLVPGKICKKVRLHGWVHDIATGKLHDLNVSLAPP